MSQYDEGGLLPSGSVEVSVGEVTFVVEPPVLTREQLARLIARAYGVPLRLIAPWAIERPVDRARRLRIERAMRLRARRAARRSRKASR